MSGCTPLALGCPVHCKHPRDKYLSRPEIESEPPSRQGIQDYLQMYTSATVTSNKTNKICLLNDG